MDCSLIYNIKAAVLGEFDHSRCINLYVLVPCSLFMWKTFPDLHTVQYLYFNGCTVYSTVLIDKFNLYINMFLLLSYTLTVYIVSPSLPPTLSLLPLHDAWFAWWWWCTDPFPDTTSAS